MFTTTTDPFGNTFLTYNGSIIDIDNIDNLHDNIECIKKENKGLIFVGFPEEVISELNTKFYNNDIIHLTDKDEKCYNLMINNSSCPQFCDAKIYASGISIIVNHLGFHYALLIKDKTKKMLSNIGGTTTQFEYKHNTNYSIDTAIRELAEETSGYVINNYTKINIDGLILTNIDQIMLLAKMELESTYYGLKVPDFYNCYGWNTNTTMSSDPFLKLLFNPENELQNKDFKMDYYDHSETEYIYAIKLVDDIIPSADNFEDTINKISEHISKINVGDSRISSVNMFFNYVHLKHIHNNTDEQYHIADRFIFNKLKMMPSLRGLYIMNSDLTSKNKL
jgi:hypothetical protein